MTSLKFNPLPCCFTHFHRLILHTTGTYRDNLASIQRGTLEGWGFCLFIAGFHLVVQAAKLLAHPTS